MFKYKQSSDWFLRYGNRRRKYSKRPFGILSRAAVSLEMSGRRCGHTGENLFQIFIFINIDLIRWKIIKYNYGIV